MPETGSRFDLPSAADRRRPESGAPQVPQAPPSQAHRAPRGQRDIAQRIRQALQQRGLTQADLVRSTGIEKSKLSKSLAGDRRFRIEELASIARTLGASLEWLGEGDGTAAAEEEPAAAPPGGAASGAVEAPAGGAAIPTPRNAGGSPAGREHAVVPRARSRAGMDRIGEPVRRTDRVRLRITETAWRQFSERGFHRVRMADIAAEAGISPAAVHYHFTSKRQLFLASLRISAENVDRDRVEIRRSAPVESASDHVALLRRLIELKVPPSIAEDPVLDGNGPALDGSGRESDEPDGNDETSATAAGGSAMLSGDWSIWLQNYAEIAVGEGSRDDAAMLARSWNTMLTSCLAAGQRAGAFCERPPEEGAAELSIFLDGVVIRALGDADLDVNRTIDSYLHHAVLAPSNDAAPALDQPESSASDHTESHNEGERE
ncbi:TetR family transcriptional regulator [Brevibacterium daeguense]|nr:TetR family transcriptional regulator [Brevibacterium daeguense]